MVDPLLPSCRSGVQAVAAIKERSFRHSCISELQSMCVSDVQSSAPQSTEAHKQFQKEKQTPPSQVVYLRGAVWFGV